MTRRWATPPRFKVDHSGWSASLSPISLHFENQKIQPQMNRMNADGEIGDPIFIRVLHLCLSCSSAVEKDLKTTIQRKEAA